MAELVRFEKRDDHVAVVTLDRPEKRNAVNGEMAQQLDGAVKRVERDADIWVAILASSNDRVFCAGADLAEVSAGRGGASVTPDGGFAGFVYHPRTKPWIAAPVGAAMGGGLELCLACDMIVAADTCRFGLPEVRLSLMATAGGVIRLPKSMPRAVALEMIATGTPIDAERAYALGLVNRVVPAERTLDAAIELAGAITANAPIAVRAALSVARQAPELGDAEGRRISDQAMEGLKETEDFVEGPRAFLEKRAPVWKGR